jgi:CDP-glucose 4,6-dehydratase
MDAGPRRTVSSKKTGWAQRVVLVTGCSGFVGTWLSLHLSDAGARVIGYSRNGMPDATLSQFRLRDRLTIVQGAVEDSNLIQKTIREYGVDTIFHLAAQSKADTAQQTPLKTFETNIGGTWNLLEAVRVSGKPIRVVLASTDTISGRELLPQANPPETITPYAASKACAELLSRTYHDTYGLQICIARTSNLYGGGDMGFQRLIPGTIRSVINGEAPVINSSGLKERDYLYVEDAVRGYMMLAAAMERPEISGQTFSFASGSPRSVTAVVDIILALMGRSDLKPRVLNQTADEGSIEYLPSAMVSEQLGWSPGSTLESGLKKTIEWYRLHNNKLDLEAGNS